jgi:hypothetical protein
MSFLSSFDTLLQGEAGKIIFSHHQQDVGRVIVSANGFNVPSIVHGIHRFQDGLPDSGVLLTFDLV